MRTTCSPDHFCWSPDGKSLACALMTWQRDEQNRKVLGIPGADPNPQIVIVNVEGEPGDR